MQRAHSTLGRASSLALALLLDLAPASAEQVPLRATEIAASESFAARAFDAYAQKDYAAAVDLYHQALAASPSADILYNLARVYDIGLKDRARAIGYYVRYVADPGALAGRIELANRRLGDLRAAEAAAGAPAAPVPAPAAAGDAGMGAVAVAVAVLGLVGVGIGLGFGLAATSAPEEAEGDCEGDACAEQHGDAAHATGADADVGVIGFAVGGALLALGTAFWLLADAEQDQPASVSALEVEPGHELGVLPVAFSGGAGP